MCLLFAPVLFLLFLFRFRFIIVKEDFFPAELKLSTDRDEGFLEVKEAEAKEQHKSIISALKVAAPRWEFEQINIVVGDSGLVVKVTSSSSKSLMYNKEKTTTSSLHVTQVYEALNQVIVSFTIGARRHEANHRGIEGEHRAQCAVRR